MSLQRSQPSSNLAKTATGFGSGSTSTGKPGFSLSGSGTGFGSRLGQPQKPPPAADPYTQKIQTLKEYYTESSTSYKFQAIVYNPKGSGSLPAKPGSLSQEEWNDAINSSPDPEKFAPSLVKGFNGLSDRHKAQIETTKKMKEKVEDLRAKLDEMQEDYTTNINTQLAKITKNNHIIMNHLMKVLRVLEVKALKSYDFSKKEHELLDQIDQLEEEVHKPNQFVAALNTLDLKANLMRDFVATKKKLDVPEEPRKKIEAVLKLDNDAIEALIGVVKKLDKTTKSMKKTIDQLTSEDNVWRKAEEEEFSQY